MALRRAALVFALVPTLASAGCGSATPVSNPPTGVSVVIGMDGQLTIATTGVTFSQVEMIARWDDGTERALSAMSLTHESATEVAGRDASGLLFTVTVSSMTGSPGPVNLTWSLAGVGRLRGIELRLPETNLPANAHLVVDGAQSWAFSGPIAVNPGEMLPRDTMGHQTWPDGFGDVLGDVGSRSVLRGDLAWGNGGLSVCTVAPYNRWLVVGVERPTTGYALTVTDGVYADETVDLASHGPLQGHIVLAPADPNTPFACTAASSPPARTRGTRPFPRGFWTWNTFFTNVTMSRAMAGFMAARSNDPAVTHLTVDDGWEAHWGDWTESSTFGGTIADLVATLHTVPATLGLWLAPFVVDPAAPVYTQHPDWLLHDTTGAVLQVALVPPRVFGILDATNPDAMTYLTSVFQGLRAQGVSLFKIDYLYAAAWPAVRHDPNATGLSAYALGLAAIAAGAGDAHLNGCGAFMLPTLPFVDSLRVGADDAYMNVTPFWGAVAASARNLAVRRGLVDLGVAPDPDQPVVHALTPDQGRAYLAVGALSGGAFGYGDNLATLSPAESALYNEPWFTRLRNSVPLPAVPQDIATAVGARFELNPVTDLLSSGGTSAVPPSIFSADLDQGQRVVALFNWSSDDADIAAHAALFASSTAVVEQITGASVASLGGHYTVHVPAQAVRVLFGARPMVP